MGTSHTHDRAVAPPVIYISGPDRIVCTRSIWCAGRELLANVVARPHGKFWVGISGTRWRRMTDAQIAAERAWCATQFGSSALCECEMREERAQ